MLEMFLIHTLNNVHLEDPHSIERVMCNRMLIKIEQDHILQNVLQDIPTWRRLQKNNSQLSDDIIQEVYTVKSKNIKQKIEQQLVGASQCAPPRRKL